MRKETSMIRKIKGFTGIAIMAACLMMTATGCSLSSTTSEGTTNVAEQATFDPNLEKATSMEYVVPEEKTDIYTEETQQKAAAEIEEKLASKLYTVEAPLVYYNLFGTNTHSANIYFSTEEAVSASYTVSVEDETIKDFTRKLATGEESGVTTNHAYQLIGLIPNVENTITITLYDKDGNQTKESTFTIQVPDVQSDADKKLALTDEKTEELTDGLFCVVYGRIDNLTLNISLYDNDGILRGELPVESYRTDRILTIDGYLYYNVSETKIVKVDRLGQVVKIYDIGEYEFHHDMVYEESQNSLVILASDTREETVEDIIISLNLESGEVKELLDLKDLLPDAYEKAVKPDKKSKLDWAHVNALQVIDGSDVILSFRELSSIVSVKDIFTNPELEYILSEKSVWEGTPYEEYVYDKVGDFTPQAGQHCITYVEGEADGEYYIYMFNNNFTYSGTRKDIDWSGYTLSQVDVEERESFYYRYKINENDKTFELVNSFAVPYSAYVSSVQPVDEHYVVCSGSQRLFGEYDSEGKLIRQYQSQLEQYIYRTFKYTFDGIWFSK